MYNRTCNSKITKWSNCKIKFTGTCACTGTVHLVYVAHEVSILPNIERVYLFLIYPGEPFSETLFFKRCPVETTKLYSALKVLQGAGAICSHCHKHQGKPLLFHDKCPGFFYVHYTTHGTYSFTSHPKDEAIMVKCLAPGHKYRD